MELNASMSAFAHSLASAAIALPLIPFITRACLWTYYRTVVQQELKDEARQEEQHRSAILAIAGFSLTLFSAFVIVDQTIDVQLEMVIYFSGCSFVAYLAAFAIQIYKPVFLVDQVGDAAMDCGSFCLILSLVGLLMARPAIAFPSVVLMTAALIVWTIEHTLKLWLSYRYLSQLKRRRHG
jgi:hypothetical protein